MPLSRHSAEVRARRAATPYPMSTIGRKSLPHDVPSNIGPNPEGEVFFITICTEPRGENQLAHASIWDALCETIEIRESRNDIHCRLLLAMPDHLHGLFAFPGNVPMQRAITSLKSWMAKQHGIRWQRDFFDHRLRSWESAEEKATYIRMNPVRAGLVTNPEDWPFYR
ncbi:MAG: REP-associated tyrosine transposase [Luteolibacter sp.]